MVRVGFIGLGHNGLAHIGAHRRVGKSKVVALCDSNPERLEAASRRFGIDRVYESAEALCAEDDIDAVSVNTGDPFHEEPFVAAVTKCADPLQVFGCHRGLKASVATAVRISTRSFA